MAAQFPQQPLSPPFDPLPYREAVRAVLVFAAMGIFFFVISVYLNQAAKGGDPHWQNTKEAMQTILPAVTSMLGTALGFYYGSTKR